MESEIVERKLYNWFLERIFDRDEGIQSVVLSKTWRNPMASFYIIIGLLVMIKREVVFTVET